MRRLLALVRPYVDEIVLAGDEATREACSDLADRVVDHGASLQAASRSEWLLV